VDNNIHIELLFKRGQTPTLAEVEKVMGVQSSIISNFTLISERGVRVFDAVEEIIQIFTEQRLAVVKRRYELLIQDCEERILKNNEIIRFIKEKHYGQAEKKANRKDFVDYLSKNKFNYAEYLADMAIYRMTKEEVGKRQLYVKEDGIKLKDYQKVLKSDALIRKKLIEELHEVDEKLTKIMDEKEKAKKQVYAKLSKAKPRKK
jgi:DNA gyrase subunit A